MFGTTVYSTISENNGEDASADDDYEPTILGSKIILEWELRNVKLDHDYAITGWDLSVIPEVRADVEERLTGDHCNAIKRVVSKIARTSVSQQKQENKG